MKNLLRGGGGFYSVSTKGCTYRERPNQTPGKGWGGKKGQRARGRGGSFCVWGGVVEEQKPLRHTFEIKKLHVTQQRTGGGV